MTYISGAITNNPNYEQQFNEAEKFLKRKNIKVLNPIKHEPKGKDWNYYMKRDIKKLLKCTAIYMLKGWEKLNGNKADGK